jgi:RNA polymerase I-specific transcription initiation factor RRN3
MLTLVPTAPASLLPLVVQHMPHKLRDRNTQCLFLTAVFAMAEAPAGRPIRDSLLAAAVEHLLSLDVDIKWEDIVDVPTGGATVQGCGDEPTGWAVTSSGPQGAGCSLVCRLAMAAMVLYLPGSVV